MKKAYQLMIVFLVLAVSLNVGVPYDFYQALNFAVTANAASEVSYVDADGNLSTVSDYTTVKSSTTTWNAGWYVVTGNVTISQRVTVNGDVKLILTDGCHLTVNGGIQVSSGNSFAVYAQTLATGKLTATATTQGYTGIGGNFNYRRWSWTNCGRINFYGGIITATGKTYTTAFADVSGIGDSISNPSNNAKNIGYYGGTVNGTVYDTMPNGYSLKDITPVKTAAEGETLILKAAVQNNGGHNFVKQVTYLWYGTDGKEIANSQTTGNQGTTLSVTQSGTYQVKATYGKWSQTLNITVTFIAPSYIVTIPSEVNIGEEMIISAKSVSLPESKSLNVKLTDADDFQLKYKTDNNITLKYKVQEQNTDVPVNSIILTVPSGTKSGSSTLTTVLDDKPGYSGEYTGKLTFTVSVDSSASAA